MVVSTYEPLLYPLSKSVESLEVKDECHRLVATIATWSMRCALKGKAPVTGPFGEPLTKKRAERGGQPLSYNGYLFAYFGFRADAKARKECHKFERNYQCNQICEVCLAERPNKYGDPALTFKNFYSDAAHLLTNLTHAEYLATSNHQSPWENMPGFHVKSCFRDPMHTLFLGTAKDLLASCLGLWCRNGYIEGPNLAEKLRWVSATQREYCKAAGLRATFKTFTPANTNLDKRSEFPEIGSAFKAATIKTSIWFFTKLSSEIAASNPEVLVEKMLFFSYILPKCFFSGTIL